MYVESDGKMQKTRSAKKRDKGIQKKYILYKLATENDKKLYVLVPKRLLRRLLAV